MTDQSTRPITDFSGFLDGFQARNMAAIEQSASLQLSELQARLLQLRTVIQRQAVSEPALSTIKNAETTLRDGSGTIVSRLTELGQLLQRLIIENPSTIMGDDGSREQMRWILRRYVEAAEISHHDGLLKAAVNVLEAFSQTADSTSMKSQGTTTA